MILDLGGEDVDVIAPDDTRRTVTTIAPLEPRPSSDAAPEPGEAIVYGWNLYLPPDDPVTHFDRVEVRGQEYRIQGIPDEWPDLCVIVRAYDASGYSALVTLRKAATTGWSDEAEATTTTPAATYASNVAARIQDQVRASSAVDGISAEETLTDAPYLIAIEADVAPAEGDEVEVTACTDDTSLVGRVFRIDRVGRGTERFERQLFCTLVDAADAA